MRPEENEGIAQVPECPICKGEIEKSVEAYAINFVLQSLCTNMMSNAVVMVVGELEEMEKRKKKGKTACTKCFEQTQVRRTHHGTIDR